jgi:PAS domain S-box-containing protein
MFADIQSYLKENTNWIYYTLTIIGVLYTFMGFVKYRVKKADWFNLLKLITEVPTTIVEIKEGQTEIFNEIKLHGKVVNTILDTLEMAQFICDFEGKCIKVNSKWISLTGLSEEDALGNNWLLSVHIEDRQEVQKKWHNMIAYNTPFEEIFRYQHRVTDMITKVKCKATDVVDESGKRIFIIGLSRVL